MNYVEVKFLNLGDMQGLPVGVRLPLKNVLLNRV